MVTRPASGATKYDPNSFNDRSWITPTPQPRPADAPPMTTQNPVDERWGSQSPSNADAMRNAIALQMQRNQIGSWTYQNAPSAGVTPGYNPDQMPFTGYNYFDTLTPNNQNQYRGLEGQYLPGTYDMQILLDQITRAQTGAGQDYLSPQDQMLLDRTGQVHPGGQ